MNTVNQATSPVQTRLVPGTYRLSEECGPLRNDKRKKNDWRCNKIAAGTLFFYTEWTYAPSEEHPQATVTERRLFPVGCYGSEGVAPNESHLTRELEELLVAVDESPSLWLRREHSTAAGLDVLDNLFACGKLTLADVKWAANAQWPAKVGG